MDWNLYDPWYSFLHLNHDSGGVLSLIISLLSFYIYFSLIIRSLIGRDVLPLGPALFDVKTMKFRFVAFGRNIHDYSIGHLHHV